MYKITLSDGTVIDNLIINGDNFISEEPISNEVFVGNLSPVIIDDGDNEISHPSMELIQLKEYFNKNTNKTEYWFILFDITQDKLDQIKIRADIDYIAMINDIDLEEE